MLTQKMLSLLLCLELVAGLFAASAAQPAAPTPAAVQGSLGVCTAVAGAAQIEVVRQAFLEPYDHTVVYIPPVPGGPLPLYEEDPLGCISAAIVKAAEGAEQKLGICRAGLIDLNWDGIPELILNSEVGGSGVGTDVYAIAGGELIRLRVNGNYLHGFARVYDSDGTPQMCMLSRKYAALWFRDEADFFSYSPDTGWHIRRAKWYYSMGPHTNETFRTPFTTTVFDQDEPILDPGDVLYRQLTEQPVEAYVFDAGNTRANASADSVIAAIPNYTVKYTFEDLEWWLYQDLTQPEYAREMAEKLLQAWRALRPAAPYWI